MFAHDVSKKYRKQGSAMLWTYGEDLFMETSNAPPTLTSWTFWNGSAFGLMKESSKLAIHIAELCSIIIIIVAWIFFAVHRAFPLYLTVWRHDKNKNDDW